MRVKSLFLTLLTAILCCMPATAQQRTASSVLATGTWHKVSVEQTGIYFLSTAQLQQMGFANPDRVRVYGNGGRQLSFTVGLDLRDDLRQLPTVRRPDGILFYAEGPTAWDARANGVYTPALNAYSRKAYYFVTDGIDNDELQPYRLPDYATGGAAADIDTYDTRACHAPQTFNLDNSGREWLGERITQQKNNLKVGFELPTMPGAPITVTGRVVTTISKAAPLTVSCDDKTLGTVDIPATTGIHNTATPVDFTFTDTAASNVVEALTLSQKFTTSIERIQVSRLIVCSQAPLALGGAAQLGFRSNKQFKAFANVRFNIANVPAGAMAIDVTDPTAPLLMATAQTAGTLSFVAEGGDTNEYHVFDPSGSFPAPVHEGRMENHDAHAHSSVNYLIITKPEFAPWAERLGRLHSDLQGLSWRVAFVDELFDEFAAGRAEAPAIRNYIKMLYDRGKGTPDQLRYVLLLGDGTYDNFDRTSSRNVVPTYQSAVSYGLTTTYATDDFYGWMERGEGTFDVTSTVDIGLGRLPVGDTSEAEAAVAKIERYMTAPAQGQWKQMAVFVGCAGDENEHTGYAERQAAAFEEENPDMNVVRIFSESYRVETSATGTSYPQAVNELRGYMNTGVGLLHYTGHGGYDKVDNNYYTNAVVAAMTNEDKCVFSVSASCTYCPFDQERGTLAHAGIFNNAKGGFIGAFVANREVFGNGNYSATRAFTKALYATDMRGAPLTAGDAMMQSKRTAQPGINTCKYHLIADPALIIARPRDLYAVVDSANGQSIDDEELQPFKALGDSHLTGSIRNADGTVASDFNGTAWLTLYDKRSQKATSGQASGKPFAYTEWANKLYSGSVEVKDGLFAARFVLPKDFDLSVGNGRLLMFASATDGRDAMGACEQLLVGDFETSSALDTIGPGIEAWVAMEAGAPMLYARIGDPQGVNTSGQGVGHDITLVTDNRRTEAISLNAFFSYNSGSATDGLVVYPLAGLGLGEHNFTIKAWDNLNNSNSVSLWADLRAASAGLKADINFEGGTLQALLSTNMLGAELRVRTRVYTTMGIQVADHTCRMPNTNGSQPLRVPMRQGALASGIYVVKIDVENLPANGNSGSTPLQKASLSKKMFVGAQ